MEKNKTEPGGESKAHTAYEQTEWKKTCLNETKNSNKKNEYSDGRGSNVDSDHVRLKMQIQATLLHVLYVGYWRPIQAQSLVGSAVLDGISLKPVWQTLATYGSAYTGKTISSMEQLTFTFCLILCV